MLKKHFFVRLCIIFWKVGCIAYFRSLHTQKESSYELGLCGNWQKTSLYILVYNFLSLGPISKILNSAENQQIQQNFLFKMCLLASPTLKGLTAVLAQAFLLSILFFPLHYLVEYEYLVNYKTKICCFFFCRQPK